mgnify:CR=1 FL=1
MKNTQIDLQQRCIDLMEEIDERYDRNTNVSLDEYVNEFCLSVEESFSCYEILNLISETKSDLSED